MGTLTGIENNWIQRKTLDFIRFWKTTGLYWIHVYGKNTGFNRLLEN